MIAVLGGLADVERDLIRTGAGEGRARAKLRGLVWAWRRRFPASQPAQNACCEAHCCLLTVEVALAASQNYVAPRSQYRI